MHEMMDFFGTGVMVVALKQAGAVDYAREMTKISVKVAASWLAHVFRT